MIMAGHEQLPVRSERSARVTVGQKSLDDGFWKSPHTGALPIVVVADQSRLTDVRFTVECKDDPPGSAVPLNPINCTFGFGETPCVRGVAKSLLQRFRPYS